ncbi:unnamed protein product [Prunus brigantina]
MSVNFTGLFMASNKLHVHGLIVLAPFFYPLVFQEVWQTLHFLSFSRDPTPSFSSCVDSFFSYFLGL